VTMKVTVFRKYLSYNKTNIPVTIQGNTLEKYYGAVIFLGHEYVYIYFDKYCSGIIFLMRECIFISFENYCSGIVFLNNENVSLFCFRSST
jgi:hypothetical protein